jgi:ubiquinol-cytochrome c reductase cytochrome c1 subunit
MKKILAFLPPPLPASPGPAAAASVARARPDQPARQDLAAARRGALREPLPQLPLGGVDALHAALEDLGLTEAQIRENLLFTEREGGRPMTAAMDPKVAKAAFGVVPPDLSLIGALAQPDWLYTYLRSFYRDPATRADGTTPSSRTWRCRTCCGNTRATRLCRWTEKMDRAHGDRRSSTKLVLDRPGTHDAPRVRPVHGGPRELPRVHGRARADEPQHWGILVLFFLAGFFVLALMLKKEYWNDVR